MLSIVKEKLDIDYVFFSIISCKTTPIHGCTSIGKIKGPGIGFVTMQFGNHPPDSRHS